MIEVPQAPHQSSFVGLIGVWREDITPGVGIYCRNWGAAKHDVATGIHRPLTVTVLTLQATEADSPFLIGALDLGWWKTGEDEWLVRGGLIDALDLDPDRVLLNLSHTHSAPVICREDADKPGGQYIEPFLIKVRDALIACARNALAHRKTAALDWSYGKCDLAQNRDLVDPERPRIVCGYNPNLIGDDTVLVGRVSEKNGHVVATLVNYACHPTTLAFENDLISPDYVGEMREVIETYTLGAPCLFLQGASGELGPREGYTVPIETADANGRKLGYAVASTLEGMLPPLTRLTYAGVVESGAPLATWKHEPLQPSTATRATVIAADVPLKANLPTLEQIDTELQKCTDRTFVERITRKRRVRRLVGDKDTKSISVWIWRIGEAIIVAQPQEAYSWLQTELRRKFPNRAVAVLNVTNGTIGYLPPAQLYDEDIYQVWQTPFDRGGLEIIEAAAALGINATLA